MFLSSAQISVGGPRGLALPSLQHFNPAMDTSFRNFLLPYSYHQTELFFSKPFTLSDQKNRGAHCSSLYSVNKAAFLNASLCLAAQNTMESNRFQMKEGSFCLYPSYFSSAANATFKVN
jgi:hypothetical protein